MRHDYNPTLNLDDLRDRLKCGNGQASVTAAEMWQLREIFAEESVPDIPLLLMAESMEDDDFYELGDDEFADEEHFFAIACGRSLQIWQK